MAKAEELIMTRMGPDGTFQNTIDEVRTEGDDGLNEECELEHGVVGESTSGGVLSPPTLRSGVVPNDSPELYGFLVAAKRDPAGTLPILADWLEDQGDHRAACVRDIVAMTLFDPPTPAPRRYVTIATGPGWGIERSQSVVRMLLSPESRLARLLGSEWRRRERLYRNEQSPSHVRSAIETCRLASAFALFGMWPETIPYQNVIASSPMTAKLFRRINRNDRSPEIVASLASVDLARFSELMMLFGRRPSLRWVGEAVVTRFRGETRR
jgi:hypothetical protein